MVDEHLVSESYRWAAMAPPVASSFNSELTGVVIHFLFERFMCSLLTENVLYNLYEKHRMRSFGMFLENRTHAINVYN